MRAEDIVRTLSMEPHPEGGWYAETFRDARGGVRGHSTAIYYLLEAGQRSHWHRVRDAAEVWHYYAGAPLRLSISADGHDKRGGDPWGRSCQGRASAGDRSHKLVASGRKSRRLHAGRLHGGAGFRVCKLRTGAAGLETQRQLNCYCAASACGTRLRRIIGCAARTAPPVTKRQARAIPQLGSAKPKSVRMRVENNGAA